MMRIFLVFSLISGLYGLGNFIYYWDPTRVIVKKLTTKDPYRYSEIKPEYLEQDVSELIALISAEDLASKREVLAQIAFGNQPAFDLRSIQVKKDLDKLPADCHAIWRYEHLNCKAAQYKGWRNLAGIDRLRIPIITEGNTTYDAYIGYFRAASGNNRLMLIHHGYAGVYHEQHRHIERLIKKGYSVLAFNLYGYGLYERSEDFPPGALPDIPSPHRLFFKQVKMAIDYALAEKAYKSIDMMGLSAGGWVASVYGALDDRVRASYPVAGVFPMYLREEKERPEPQISPLLLAAASYPEIFVLASAGPKKRQMQIFNRYDRCCYRNTKGKLYEDAVKATLKRLGMDQNNFSVVIDETHPRHKISAFAMDAILADMARLNQGEAK